MSAAPAEKHASAKLKLAVGAIGVAFGDIGTSPLYAFRETFAGPHHLALDDLHIYGVISLIFWSMTLIVSVQYVGVLMSADNKGEGGTLALVALISRKIGRANYGWLTVLLAVLATSLFYGDSMITPAVSVLSAVEGLIVVQPSMKPLVVPIAVVLLVGLFLLQRRGTTKVGALFAPIMLVYFVTLAVLGVIHILTMPSILMALNPWYAVQFFLTDKWLAFLALGSVVLAVTGSEALYSDMGHFGIGPMRFSWFGFVLPCLLLNYFGQGAMILGMGDATAAEAIRNPFFYMAPEVLRLPLVLLATAAAFIASQAVITGAFSVTHQAIQLGFVPRLSILHTHKQHRGQIYIPLVNWLLCVAVIGLVLFFRSSSSLASAYGIAVTGAMLIDTCLMAVLLVAVWKWRWYFAAPMLTVFFVVDGGYFAANATKIPYGGWFPLLVGAIAFTLLTTWAKGRKLMRERMSEVGLPLEIFAKSARNSTARVPGTAIFMNSGSSGTPSALLHNIKHNKVLHERVVVLTVKIAEVPYVDPEERFSIGEVGDGFFRVVLNYGFMEETDVPAALKEISKCGAKFEMMQTSFFLSRQTLIASKHPGMALWREKLFAWMMRNAATPMEFFRLPTNRVVELGSQVEIDGLAEPREARRMIALPTAIWAHYLGDAAAWTGAALMARWQYRRWPDEARELSRRTEPSYFVTLAVCAVLGAWLIGTLNLSSGAGRVIPSHSIAGALAGGILGVELWKWRHGIRQSTGGPFVAPLSVGIVLGRLGCLFAGLPDRTFGTPTALPWAVDLGDGVGRHPVQLYESLTMGVFLVVYLHVRTTGHAWARTHAFHALITVYAAQRFVWEFFKPYPTVAGPLNVFQLLMLGLIAYGLAWWRRDDNGRAPAAR